MRKLVSNTPKVARLPMILRTSGSNCLNSVDDDVRPLYHCRVGSMLEIVKKQDECREWNHCFAVDCDWRPRRCKAAGK